jgi:hypothetical protein
MSSPWVAASERCLALRPGQLSGGLNRIRAPSVQPLRLQRAERSGVKLGLGSSKARVGSAVRQCNDEVSK